MQRPDLSLIGAGNVATHLGQAFLQAGCTVRQVHSKTPGHAGELAGRLNATVARSIAHIEESDFLLVAIRDDAIAEVAEQLGMNATMVLHTSGTTPMDVLSNTSEHYGVLYPLQTFSKERPVAIDKVPLLLEANSEYSYERLEAFARLISTNLAPVNSADRLKYHLSAVIANNFTNHLWREAHDYLTRHNLDFTVLHPLIRETVDKALELGPENAQTGPAQRHDHGTIQQHLDLLAGEELKVLYEFLTERIEKKK